MPHAPVPVSLQSPFLWATGIEDTFITDPWPAWLRSSWPRPRSVERVHPLDRLDQPGRLHDLIRRLDGFAALAYDPRGGEADANVHARGSNDPGERPRPPA